MADLCYGCMKDTRGEQICPHCGFSQDTEQFSPFLPLGTGLENDRYTVGKVLDTRADSVRYIGYDNKAEKIVEIREFLPENLIKRTEGSSVVTVNKGCSGSFNALKEKFTDMGQAVMNLENNDIIVKIENVFQDNNTVYTVSGYEDVISFEDYVKKNGGHLEWESLRAVIKPLLEGMIALTESGMCHLGICPLNILVTSEGIKLDDFAIREVRQTGNGIEPELFSGCSAPEQYEDGAELDVATDVYGFCASMFFALTGKLPLDAVKRKEDGRLLMSTSIAKKLPPFVISTLAKGLQVNKAERISSFRELAEQLSAAPTVKAMQDEISKTVEVPKEDVQQEEKGRMSNFKVGVIAMLIALAVFGGLGYLWYSTHPLDGMFDVNNEATQSATMSSGVMPEDFTYAADSEYFRVPDFIGKTWEEAKTVADSSSEYSIYKAIDEEFSDTVPEGKICKQTPDAKKTVSRGNDGVTVICTISKGTQYRELPKVQNVNKDVATENLVNNGFVVNSTLGYSDSIPAGNVIGYSGNIKEGDKQEYGSTITINVSLGKKPESATEQTFVYKDRTAPAIN